MKEIEMAQGKGLPTFMQKPGGVKKDMVDVKDKPPAAKGKAPPFVKVKKGK